MAAYRGSSWPCSVCDVTCSSPQVLAYHVIKGEQHKENLSRTAPKEVNKLARLQYFLDAHMKEEPTLGLEYIVEEQLDSASYKYTCQLCHVEADLCEAFIHITKADHMERYIDKHYTFLSVNAGKYYKRTDYLKALRARALQIQNQVGRKKVKTKHIGVNGPTATQETKPPLSEDSSKKADALLRDEKSLNDGRVCELCNVSFSTAVDLCSHVMTHKHKQRLSQIAAEEVKDVGRLWYFLDKYMKKDPFVGLEYIVEKQVDSASYKYTCQLCDVEGNLPVIIAHIGHVGHVEQVQKTQSAVESSTSTQMTVSPHPEDSMKKVGPFLHDGKGVNRCRTCDLCKVSCFLIKDLWKHIMGNKHKLKLSQTAPEEVKELCRLQYFLDRHVKEEPFLGLEHIVEEQLDSASYKYTCRLCNVEGDLLVMFNHISSVGHVEHYIDRHHSDLSLKLYAYPQRIDYLKALTTVALMIREKYGCKEIALKGTAINDPVTAKLSPKDDGKKDVKKQYFCSLCDIPFPSVVQLCDHVMGREHKKRLNRAAPEEVEEVGRLQYFLDTHMKEEPILGLEHIAEKEQLDSSYKYTCHLCNVEANLRQMLIHIGSVDHVLCYVNRHHSELIPTLNNCRKDKFFLALNKIAGEISRNQGRKKVTFKNTVIDGATPAKVAKLSL